MQKVLVTGGAGFLGSHLCEALLEQGHEVICLDNFSTGSEDNIQHLAGHANFRLIKQDIIEAINVQANKIYNLACPASPEHYQKDPIHTTKTNVIGTMNLLELAKRQGATLLQASTSEVYGDPEVHPQVEIYKGSVNPIGIRACYDEGKRCAETLCFDYHREHNVAIKVARIFNTYGPKMQSTDGRVVSNFINQAINNQPITIYGDGTQTRSLCFVSDLITGLMKLMESDPSIKGPINLGNPQEVTINQLATLIKNITRSHSDIEYRSLPSDDPKQRCPDITLAKQLLSWQPSVDLEQGLASVKKHVIEKSCVS